MSLGRRLLVVTESLGVGGTESHLIRLLPKLTNSGWTVAVYCLTERGKRADELESEEIEVLSQRPHSGEKDSYKRRPKKIARSAISLLLFMRRWRPQIAHFYLPGPYVVGAPVAIAQKLPVKIMSRRSLSTYQQNWPLARQIERTLHRHMDALIGNSQAVVRQLLDEGAPKHKVSLIYNGIEIGAQQPDRLQTRRKLGINEQAFVGIIVANLIHYKGHQDLIRGFSQIAGQLPSNWQLLLVGADQGLRAKLEAVVKKEQLADHVRFLGQRSDVAELLVSADIGLLTSHQEGFSNVILEGMAAGLPMIVTDVGGNPEAVVNGKTGLVVPPHDPNAIGKAVLRLARDSALRNRFGAAGSERVRNTFTLEKCTAAHAELYEMLLSKAVERRILTEARSSPPRATRELSTKRPLMLAYWGRFGALPQFTVELAEACRRSGHLEQTTLSISTSNELFDEYRPFGDAIFPIVTYPSALSAANVRAALRSRNVLRQRLHEDQTRAFVTLMPHVWSPLITPILKEAGIRHTVIVHDADPHRGDSTALINKWLLREAKSADHIVTLTHVVAERLIEKKLIAREKISVLFHPDLTYAPGQSRERAVLRILFFGRLLPYKGLDLFVRAMELLKQAGVPIKIGVFGKGDLGRERERLGRLGAEVVNRWIEPRQIAEILARHDIAVVSHTAASQSGVIAAAHGAGVPVVATPVGGLTEQVIHEFNGLIASETTAEAVAHAVRRLCEDPNLISKLRANIRVSRSERSMERFFCELSRIALNADIATNCPDLSPASVKAN